MTQHDSQAVRDAQPGMAWAITGATGLLGEAIQHLLADEHHEISHLVRPGSEDDRDASTILWDPQAGELDAEELEGIDVVVHLAGENIAARRWSNAQKQRIRDSRVKGTQLLAETIASMDEPPKVFICASGAHYYSDRGDEMLDESSEPGRGFLADVVRAWEQATQPAREAGVRTVNLRFGMVLSAADGPLAKMLTPFKLGVGGRVADGRQYWPWIHVEDAARAVRHVAASQSLDGPVNVVTPTPITNEQFTKALGRVLGRPTIAPMPAIAARLMLGEMADELLLASLRVLPKRLTDDGFAWRWPDLESALRHELSRAAKPPSNREAHV